MNKGEILSKEDYQIIWREQERELEKINRILEKRNLESPITQAALRRHQLIRKALVHLYRESYYTH